MDERKAREAYKRGTMTRKNNDNQKKGLITRGEKEKMLEYYQRGKYVMNCYRGKVDK